eukprot:gnl/MRDRNA2_/MRDRNA2_30161_c0_seq2.p2 gnl/MRDRNA2_/MRDRNA2_30161_c0~~gnl/MRDRNA2_/MRDRNA2_30161_c0_seq2.p2  ORF type:complete len:108 (-),score=35.20 gnl/MRDRNA2_/MRDRNA2_30161_c0_seq2:86-409(-)
MMRNLAIILLLAAGSMASMHTRGTQQRSKMQAQEAVTKYMTWWEVAKEEPAAPEGTATAPEQGFEGKDVQHVDMDTATGDWRREYGPKGPPHHPAAEMKSKKSKQQN